MTVNELIELLSYHDGEKEIVFEGADNNLEVDEVYPNEGKLVITLFEEEEVYHAA